MYFSASLFLKKWKLHSFGMNTSVYKHVHKIVQNFGYRFHISKILICPFPEKIQNVQIIFSRIARRDTSCLRRYDYLCYQIVDPLCDVFLFHACFPLTKLVTKIGFFVTRKGPRTHVIIKKSGELSQNSSYRKL